MPLSAEMESVERKHHCVLLANLQKKNGAFTNASIADTCSDLTWSISAQHGHNNKVTTDSIQQIVMFMFMVI